MVGPGNEVFVKRPVVAQDQDSQAVTLGRAYRGVCIHFVGTAAGSPMFCRLYDSLSESGSVVTASPNEECKHCITDFGERKSEVFCCNLEAT